MKKQYKFTGENINFTVVTPTFNGALLLLANNLRVSDVSLTKIKVLSGNSIEGQIHDVIKQKIDTHVTIEITDIPKEPSDDMYRRRILEVHKDWIFSRDEIYKEYLLNMVELELSTMTQAQLYKKWCNIVTPSMLYEHETYFDYTLNMEVTKVPGGYLYSKYDALTDTLFDTIFVKCD